MADNNIYDEYTSKTGFRYIWGRIKTIFATKTDVNTGLGGKVDKVEGKGLSTNDYDDDAVAKLSGIATGAEVNDISSISVNNTPVTADVNKNVNINVPTRTSDLTNNSGFQTASDVQSLIDTAVSGIQGISFNFDYNSVANLPNPGELGTIYFVPNGSTESTNTYDEYVWVTSTSRYEKIGTATIDTSVLWSKSELVAMTTEEIDAIIDGE